MATGVNQFALPADPDVLARLVANANALDLIAVITATTRTTTEQPGQRGARFRPARSYRAVSRLLRCAQEHSPDSGNPNPAYASLVRCEIQRVAKLRL
jgi:hypothetical protein